MLQAYLTNHRNLLAVLCALVSGVWFVGGKGFSHIGALAACGAAAYLVAELDNAFALVRVSQRTVCTLMFFLLAAVPSYHVLCPAHLSILCSVLVLFPFFAAYQQPRLTAMPCLMGLALGLCSLVVAPVLLLILPLWEGMAMMRSLSLRGWVASVLGVLTPVVWWVALQPFLPEAWGVPFPTWRGWLALWPGWVWEAWTGDVVSGFYLRGAGLTLLMWLIGLVEVLRNTSGDRTRTRFQHYAVQLLSACALVLLILRPCDAALLLPWVLTGAAVSGGHFLTLSTGRFSNILAIVLCVLVVVACVTSFLSMP